MEINVASVLNLGKTLQEFSVPKNQLSIGLGHLILASLKNA